MTAVAFKASYIHITATTAIPNKTLEITVAKQDVFPSFWEVKRPGRPGWSDGGSMPTGQCPGDSR